MNASISTEVVKAFEHFAEFAPKSGECSFLIDRHLHRMTWGWRYSFGWMEPDKDGRTWRYILGDYDIERCLRENPNLMGQALAEMCRASIQASDKERNPVCTG